MKIGNVSRWLLAIVATLIAVALGTTPARADDKKCSYAPEFYELLVVRQRWSIKRFGASVSAIFTNLVPVFGVAISVLLLGEPLLASMLIGGAVAICGVMMVSLLK
jgi:hypothetical protein